MIDTASIKLVIREKVAMLKLPIRNYDEKKIGSENDKY